MLVNPGSVALTCGSVLVSGFTLYAASIGLQIIRRWDIHSGSDLQLALERKTYLISTVLAYVLAYELFSLILFIHMVDLLHDRFVGAMCAAGSLNVNDYGYPTLILKLLNFFLCGTWLVLNHTDNQGFDYPLIKSKYKFLIYLSGCLLVETLFQGAYFGLMRTDVITSCCGILFDESAPGIAGELASLPSGVSKILLGCCLFLTLRTGVHFYATGKAARLYAVLATGTMIVSLVSVISFISLYYYELPTHHCPFCLLREEYHNIGYFLYMALLGAGIAAASIGMLERFKDTASLHSVIPVLQRRLCALSLIGYIVFVLFSVYPMIFSDFKLEGY